jgi:hypothetical protein
MNCWTENDGERRVCGVHHVELIERQMTPVAGENPPRFGRMEAWVCPASSLTIVEVQGFISFVVGPRYVSPGTAV